MNRVTAIKTRPRCFNRLWRQIAVKTFIILSILVALTVSLPSNSIKKAPTSHALECLTVESSANQDQNQVEMSVDEHPPSNLNSNASSTSGNVPPCGTKQSAGSRDHQASNLTESPPGKITWRSLEQMHQTHRNSSIPVSALNEFPPDPGEKLNLKISIAEESDEEESDDQSCNSDVGIIDGTRPPQPKLIL